MSYKIPPKALTPYYQVPDLARVEQDAVFQESPQNSKALDACLLGAPNAGKSSMMNYLVGANVSAVSNKYNTTDEVVRGIVTDIEKRAQIVLLDTPGAIKLNNSARSNLLVSRAWDHVEEQDLAIFVVDSVKRLSFDVRSAIIRLSKTKVDPVDRIINLAIKDGSFSEEKLIRGDYQMSDEEKRLYSYNMPAILVMNKVDLVTSKRRLRSLQHELEDLCPFDKIFHTSCETGFGMDALQEYIMDRSVLRAWRYHPAQSST